MSLLDGLSDAARTIGYDRAEGWGEYGLFGHRDCVVTCDRLYRSCQRDLRRSLATTLFAAPAGV